MLHAILQKRQTGRRRSKAPVFGGDAGFGRRSIHFEAMHYMADHYMNRSFPLLSTEGMPVFFDLERPRILEVGVPLRQWPGRLRRLET